MERPTIVIVVLSVLIFGLSLLRIVLITLLGEMNVEYSFVMKERAVLQHEKLLLTQQLLEESSLTTVARKAAAQGFISSYGHTYTLR